MTNTEYAASLRKQVQKLPRIALEELAFQMLMAPPDASEDQLDELNRRVTAMAVASLPPRPISAGCRQSQIVESGLERGKYLQYIGYHGRESNGWTGDPTCAMQIDEEFQATTSVKAEDPQMRTVSIQWEVS